MEYYVVMPTAIPGIRIERTVPPVYIVAIRGGKRVDSFLKVSNANRCAKRLNAEHAELMAALS